MKKTGIYYTQYDGNFPLIVGQHLSQNANDKKEVDPAIDALREATGTLPDKFSSDNGYMSGDNLEALKTADLDAYIATNKCEKKNKTPLDESNRKLTKADFVFNAQEDCFTCPGG